MAYSSIVKPSDHFNTVLYTGNTTDDRTISGVGFQPDWNWTKNRSATQHHWVADAVRGSSKMLRPDATNDEVNAPSQGSIASFNADGYVLQAGTSGDENYNYENNNYVSWNWKANGSDSSNTDGSISSTVSANTTAGFSIVKYTSGQGSNFSIGHGLGVAPKVIIAKSRNATYGWGFYYTISGTNTNYLSLNTTGSVGNNTADPDANGTASGGGGYTGAFVISDSSTIKIAQAAFANEGTQAIAYCFAEKKGYSKFGSYIGNGNANGPFVYTGFKPAWVMRKYATGGSASGEGWEMLDSARSPFNVADERLKADSNGAESTGSNYYVDFLSNGFKCRTADNATNNSGATYIYMAFAENPLVANVGQNGTPATAR